MLDALSAETRPGMISALSRSVALESFIALEAYVADRTTEYAAALTATRMSPSQSPIGSAALGRRLVAVLAKRLVGSEAAAAEQLLKDVADSVASLSTSAMVVHPLQMGWTGSNLQASDIPPLLAFAGYKEEKAWSQLTHLWMRIEGQQQARVSLKGIFEESAEFRHHAAHRPDAVLPLPNLLTLPRNVAHFACSFDLLMCMGFHALRSSSPQNQVPPPSAASSKMRRVVHGPKGWSELAPDSGRSVKRSASLEDAIKLARSRALKNAECLIVSAPSGRLCEWSYPAFA
ncbi:hypothetical protein [Cellulosimicrobium sp. CpK407]|uniref:hypothetical protein n=1 Tax=Cellulosimicrobium sp. CpK407 TaxID=3229847 RepID=UPI003F3FC41B